MLYEIWIQYNDPDSIPCDLVLTYKNSLKNPDIFTLTRTFEESIVNGKILKFEKNVVQVNRKRMYEILKDFKKKSNDIEYLKVNKIASISFSESYTFIHEQFYKKYPKQFSKYETIQGIYQFKRMYEI